MTDMKQALASAQFVINCLKDEQYCIENGKAILRDLTPAQWRIRAEGHLQDLAAAMGYDIVKVAK